MIQTLKWKLRNSKLKETNGFPGSNLISEPDYNYLAKETRLRKLRDLLNYQLSGGLLIFAFFWIPFIPGLIIILALVFGSYHMLKTFILDKRTGWIVTFIILVIFPFIINLLSLFGGLFAAVLSLIPLISFLLISTVLKFTIHDWIEEAHFKLIRLQEKSLREVDNKTN